ncbi:MAG: response regulator [Cyanobacteria bacterium P01_E01_bin.6]
MIDIEYMALNQLIKGECDLCLLDLMLPGIDGLNVLQEARQKGIKTPIIVLTALTDTYIEQKCYGVGADAFFPKPFTFSKLIKCVDKLLS